MFPSEAWFFEDLLPGSTGFRRCSDRQLRFLRISRQEAQIFEDVAGLWPVFDIVFRSLGGSRPPDPPGWGAVASRTPRGGFVGRQHPNPGGLGGGSPPGTENKYNLFFVAKGPPLSALKRGPIGALLAPYWPKAWHETFLGTTHGQGSPGGGPEPSSNHGLPCPALDVTKPYKFTGSGAMDVTKPYKFYRVW
jgi:hypothetical protein